MHRRVAAHCAALVAMAVVAAATLHGSVGPAGAAETRTPDSWPAPATIAAVTPEPTPAPPPDPAVDGVASNYPGTAGFPGQPVVALPGALGGRYTGQVVGHVTVCADRCARVAVVDWCQCLWGTADQRVVDVSHAAWPLISDEPLSRGLIGVRLILDDPALAAAWRDAAG
ncbi:MAG: hypothetical protein ACRDHD_02435 [Candidatus Limnocylindria bacterium]